VQQLPLLVHGGDPGKYLLDRAYGRDTTDENR
jgi:hypothetical protein